ncbi:MAG: hypothetical protein ACLFO5_07925 [Opitutales bacterium]
MKRLFKITGVVFLLAVAAVAAAYFILIRPGVQKNFVENNLPPGSTVESVQVTAGRFELSGLDVRLADGTRVRVEQADTEFGVFAALFKKTINFGVLRIDGLRVDRAGAAEPAPRPVEGAPDETPDTRPALPEREREQEAEAAFLDILYGLGDLDWRFATEAIRIHGSFHEPEAGDIAFEIRSGPIRVGEQGMIEAELTFVPETMSPGGVKKYDAKVQLGFRQKKSGGLDALRFESDAAAWDAEGESLLSVEQWLDLVIDGVEDSVVIEAGLDGAAPRPGVFVPELNFVEDLALEGRMSGRANGSSLLLESGNFEIHDKDRPFLSAELKQELSLGEEQAFAGELLEARVSDLEPAWLNPWLPSGHSLEGPPFSASLVFSGDRDGGLELHAAEPWELRGWTLREGRKALLSDLTLSVVPQLQVSREQSFRLQLARLRLRDSNATLMEGEVEASLPTLDAGISAAKGRAEARFDLPALLRQPALRSVASVREGDLRLELQLDGSNEFPLRIEGALSGLRAEAGPGARRDYRISGQSRPVAESEGAWYLEARFEEGAQEGPSTDLRLTGTVSPGRQPIPFDVELTSPRIVTADFDQLQAAFSVPAEEDEAEPRSRKPRTDPRPSAPSDEDETVDVAPPPWSNLDGRATLDVDVLEPAPGYKLTNLSAKVRVSEPRLAVSEIHGELNSAHFEGSGEVVYEPEASALYTAAGDFRVSDLNPARLGKGGDLPVSGLFDGQAEFSGGGATLAEAFENTVGSVEIKGREGRVTAFDIGSTGRLGLLGAGLLGDSLNRPGISAFGRLVPYFEEIKFREFMLELNRGEDRKIRIPVLRLLSEHLLFEGSGIIAASAWGDVLDSPSRLELQVGAKGEPERAMDQLRLLKDVAGEDGFRRWKQAVEIGGTLANPNTEALTERLRSAARSAVLGSDERKSEEEAADGSEAGEPERKKSKRERRVDDIESGIRLFEQMLR